MLAWREGAPPIVSHRSPEGIALSRWLCGSSAYRWAQVVGAAFVRPINIELTILARNIEELMNVQGIGEKSFLKLRSQLTVGGAPAPAAQQQ